MYTLILIVSSFGGIGDKPSVTTGQVTGFVNKASCEQAGKQMRFDLMKNQSPMKGDVKLAFTCAQTYK